MYSLKLKVDSDDTGVEQRDVLRSNDFFEAEKYPTITQTTSFLRKKWLE
jgi:polyisoprenoid-binding protein YceI